MKVMMQGRILLLCVMIGASTGLIGRSGALAGLPADRLELQPPQPNDDTRHVVLIAGDEEYRSEETMPMLARLLSGKHNCRCTVLFSFGPDGAAWIDPNNQRGMRGLDALDSADLMIIGTRFRRPNAQQAAHITRYLNAGKPVIGIRTATHAFAGKGDFGGIPYSEFGLRILGETWVSHHGRHKKEGARGVIVPEAAGHPILRGVQDVFAQSDVYGVVHLTEKDEILLRGAVTRSLDPDSDILADDPRNDPMQPFAWLHTYTTPDGSGTGQAFCTTAGASVDFQSADLRRLIVNAVYFLLKRQVPAEADVRLTDPWKPRFYGFINDPSYWARVGLTPADFVPGSWPDIPDP